MSIQYRSQRPDPAYTPEFDWEDTDVHHFTAVDANQPDNWGAAAFGVKAVEPDRGKVVGSLSVHAPWSSSVMYPKAGTASKPQGTLFDHEHHKAKIDTAEVDDDYQRRGIATKLKAVAEQHFGQKVLHSDTMSPMAVAWSKATGGNSPPGGANGPTWGVSSMAHMQESQGVLSQVNIDSRRIPAKPVSVRPSRAPREVKW